MRGDVAEKCISTEMKVLALHRLFFFSTGIFSRNGYSAEK